MERKSRKTRIGIVASDKMDKTVVVRVESRTRHPSMGKSLLLAKNIRRMMKIMKLESGIKS